MYSNTLTSEFLRDDLEYLDDPSKNTDVSTNNINDTPKKRKTAHDICTNSRVTWNQRPAF